MSETSQGPGWWLASDGRWYPPEQHPAAGTVLTAAPSAPYAQPPSTSGMAVASLVLSIIWLGGLGSILAIVLGFAARGDIKRNPGRKTGDGLAIAGIVIGFIGVAGIVLIIVATIALGNAASTIAQDLQPQHVRYGTTVGVTEAFDGGVTSLTVYALDYPAASKVHNAPPNVAIATARMRICAGASGSQGFEASLTSVYFADGQIGNVDLAVTVTGAGRNLASASLGAGQCATGYLPYDVARGTRPVGVEFDGDVFQSIRWS